MAQVNDYPKSIQKILDDARPKPGERIIFKLLDGLGSTGLPFTDTILDPETNKRINIAYVTGFRTNPNEESNRDQLAVFGKAQFLQVDGNIISIYGDRSDQMELFDYLFLSNRNVDNKDKPYHIRSTSYIFKASNPQKEIAEKNAKKSEIIRAQRVIEEMSDKELMDLGKGLYSNYQELGPEGVRDKLYTDAEKDPNKIKKASTDVNVALANFVRGLEEDGIIKRDGKKWVYADNGDKIVGIAPGKSAVDTLVKFLQEEKNAEVREGLRDLVSETAEQ